MTAGHIPHLCVSHRLQTLVCKCWSEWKAMMIEAYKVT